MAQVIVHEVPKRGQVFTFEGEEVEVAYIDFDTSVEDAIIGLRRLHESRTEPMSLGYFLEQNPELVLH